MTGENQKPTSKQRSLSLCLLIIPLLMWLIFVGITIGLFHWSIMVSLLYSAYLLIFPLPVAFFFKWLWARKNRGRLLLDCGPCFQKNLMKFGTSASVLTVILMMINRLVSEDLQISQHLILLCMLPASMNFVVNSGAGFGHLSFHENGIWIYFTLLPWNKVKLYEWKKPGVWQCSQLRLSSSPDSWNNFTDRFLMISDDQKDAVQKLLEEHVDDSTTTTHSSSVRDAESDK